MSIYICKHCGKSPSFHADRRVKVGKSYVFAEFESRLKPGMMGPMQLVAIEQVLQWVALVAGTVPRESV